MHLGIWEITKSGVKLFAVFHHSSSPKPLENEVMFPSPGLPKGLLYQVAMDATARGDVPNHKLKTLHQAKERTIK